jgi:tetratricopeptide (TPR) repeat protein
MANITPEQLLAEHQLLRTDPQEYLAMVNERLTANPDNPSLYNQRSAAWDNLGRLDLALADLETALRLNEKPILRLARGEILYRLGRYREALDDFRRGEALKPQLWGEFGGPVYEAECHLRLGDARAALAACARIPEGHWSPGLWGAPRGSKAEIAAEIARRAGGADAHGS